MKTGIFRKLLAIALAVALAIAAAACGKKEQGSKTEQGDAADGAKAIKLSAASSSEDVLAYLHQSFAKMNGAFENRFRVLPDCSDISSPAEADITLTVNSLGVMFYPYGDYLKGSVLNLSAAIDEMGKAALIGGSLNTPIVSFNDYALYISSALIALKAPDLTNAGWLTLNPATFIDDWNGSSVGYDSPIDAAMVKNALGGATIAETIDKLFDPAAFSAKTGNIAADSVLTTDLQEITKDIKDAITFKYNEADKSVTQTITGAAAQKALADYYGTFLPDLLDGAFSTALDSLGADTSGLTSNLEAMSDSVLLDGDIDIIYTFDNGRVAKIAAPSIKCSFKGDNGELTNVEVGLSIDFPNAKNAFDQWNLAITAKGGGENALITLSHDAGEGSDGKRDNYTLVVKDGAALENTQLYAAYSVTLSKSDDLNISLNAKAGGEDFTVKLSGRLAKTKGQLLFTGGDLRVSAGGEVIGDLGVEFTLKQTEGIQKPDVSDSVSIFAWEILP